MTDYFALLGQRRSPWLDAEELKQAFHAKTLREHPDVQGERENSSEAEVAFAQLNEAYQVLQDPKRRLHHLLALHGHAPAKTPQSVPREIEELFPLVADVTRAADHVAAKSSRATNALARSLMKADLSETKERIGGVLARLTGLHEQAISTLQDVDAKWSESSPPLAQLESLYILLAYVSRWTADLKEKQTQLSIQI